MPATASRIGFIMQDFRRVVATTQAAKDRYGNLARESEDPVETFFDDIADAQVIANERQALLSADRRMFEVGVTGLDEIIALDYVGAVPVAQYVDPERSVDRSTLVSNIIIDFEQQSAALQVWG